MSFRSGWKPEMKSVKIPSALWHICLNADDDRQARILRLQDLYDGQSERSRRHTPTSQKTLNYLRLSCIFTWMLMQTGKPEYSGFQVQYDGQSERSRRDTSTSQKTLNYLRPSCIFTWMLMQTGKPEYSGFQVQYDGQSERSRRQTPTSQKTLNPPIEFTHRFSPDRRSCCSF